MALPIREQKPPLSVVKPEAIELKAQVEPEDKSLVQVPVTPMEAEISDMVLKVVRTYEQKNNETMAEVHNKLVMVLAESKLTLPYISLMLNMVLQDVTSRAISLYNYAAEEVEEAQQE